MPLRPNLTIIPGLPATMRPLLAEFIGTFNLVLAIVCTGNPLFIGIMLVTQVFAFGFISGAAYNPAVTLACMLLGAMPAVTAGLYIVAQVVAGILAATLAAFMTESVPNGPVPQNGVGRAFVAEVVFTTTLCLVVTHVAVSKQKGNHFFGLAIGFTVAASAASSGPVSGGALNPAVATGLHMAALFHGDSTPIKHIWLYWITGLLAPVCAAVLFRLMNGDDYEHEGGEDKAVDVNADSYSPLE